MSCEIFGSTNVQLRQSKHHTRERTNTPGLETVNLLVESLLLRLPARLRYLQLGLSGLISSQVLPRRSPELSEFARFTVSDDLTGILIFGSLGSLLLVTDGLLTRRSVGFSGLL